METYVWVDAWQQRCCGEQFGVGSTVNWNVTPEDEVSEWTNKLLGEEWGRKVDFHEEHHYSEDEPTSPLSGLVKSIQVVTCDRELKENEGIGPKGLVWMPVPGSGRLREVEVADKWEPEPNPEDHSTSFDGWIVELEVVSQA